MTERRAGERQPNRKRESCTKSQIKEMKETLFFFAPYKKKKERKRVIKAVAFVPLLKIYLHHFLLGKLTAGENKTKRRAGVGSGACLGR